MSLLRTGRFNFIVCKTQFMYNMMLLGKKNNRNTHFKRLLVDTVTHERHSIAA